MISGTVGFECPTTSTLAGRAFTLSIRSAASFESTAVAATPSAVGERLRGVLRALVFGGEDGGDLRVLEQRASALARALPASDSSGSAPAIFAAAMPASARSAWRTRNTTPRLRRRAGVRRRSTAARSGLLIAAGQIRLATSRK